MVTHMDKLSQVHSNVTEERIPREDTLNKFEEKYSYMQLNIYTIVTYITSAIYRNLSIRDESYLAS